MPTDNPIHQALTRLDGHHECKLREVSDALRREGVQLDRSQIIEAAARKSGATSFSLAVDAAHTEMKRTGRLTKSTCGIDR